MTYANLLDLLCELAPFTPHTCDPRAVAAGCCHICEGDGEHGESVEHYLIQFDWTDCGQGIDVDLVALDQAFAAAAQRRAALDALTAPTDDPF